MSDLIQNLNQIYDTKLQIKSAIGTQSDKFSDYPGYITALKPNGYTYLTENGSYNISAYEYAYVNVPTGTEVEGYAYITTNGDFNISTYEMVNVDVEGNDYVYDYSDWTLFGGGPFDPNWDPEIWDDFPEYDDQDIQYNMAGDIFQDALADGTLYYEYIGYEDYPYHVEQTGSKSCDIGFSNTNPDLFRENNLTPETGIRVFAIVGGLKYYLSWTNTATYDEYGGYQMSVQWDNEIALSGENDTSEYIGIDGTNDEELWLYNCEFNTTSFLTEINDGTVTGVTVGTFDVYMPIPEEWVEGE